MLSLLITVASILFYAVATGLVVWGGVCVLDYSMDYPSPLWRLRYRLALWYGRGKRLRPPMAEGTPEAERITVPVEEFLVQNLAFVRNADWEDQTKIMRQVYEQVAAAVPGFNRWICPFCMSVYLCLFVATFVTAILLPLYGWWVILYWLTASPMVGLSAKVFPQRRG